jgi:hypothetical protein
MIVFGDFPALGDGKMLNRVPSAAGIVEWTRR